MIGIQDIAIYVPEGRVDLTSPEIANRFDVELPFLKDKTGFTSIARKSDEEETSDLAIKAINGLMDSAELAPEEIDCLVFVSQNPDDQGLPHTSSVLHRKLGLKPLCPVLDLSLGCSGWVHGMIVLQALMELSGYKRGLLVTADPYSKIISEDTRDTFLLFGDGAAATLMSDKPKWRMGAMDLGTDSARNLALNVKPDGELEMRGREVFNFASKNVPPSVGRVLDAENLCIGDIDRVLLHQGSKYIVDTIATRIGAVGKAPFVASEYGNTVSSSIPMAILQAAKETDEKILVSGFGVGLAWATAILHRVGG